MSIEKLREQRVPWPVPNGALHASCPLCGLSERRFRGGINERLAKLDAHIAGPHARCKACGIVTTPRHLRRHRRNHHRFPTLVIPGMERVA
jgi:hypothetical protein